MLSTWISYIVKIFKMNQWFILAAETRNELRKTKDMKQEINKDNLIYQIDENKRIKQMIFKI